MHRGHSCDQGPAPAGTDGPVPRTGLKQLDPELPPCCHAEAQSLDDLLELLESLSIKIAHHAILRGSLDPPSPKRVDDGAALAWIQTSLEDIGATLRGISATPREAE